MSIDMNKPIGAQIAADLVEVQRRGGLHFILLGWVFAGDTLQTLIDQGADEYAYSQTLGGREEAQVLTQLCDALHERLRRGERLSKALAGLHDEGWLARVEAAQKGGR